MAKSSLTSKEEGGGRAGAECRVRVRVDESQHNHNVRYLQRSPFFALHPSCLQFYCCMVASARCEFRFSFCSGLCDGC